MDSTNLILTIISMSIYGLSMLAIFIFSVGQLNLIFHYLKKEKKDIFPKKKLLIQKKDFPKVTIQLPIFNEKYVVNRLIDTITSLDYPKDKLQIQVLDDSTDETVEIAAKKVKFYQDQKFDIQQIRRTKRTGYKAGALAHGLDQAKARYIAIFDADFIPDSSFLKKIIPLFTQPDIGMIQSKWVHLNADYDILTKVQAFWLNAHFTIEQKGREKAGSFINFNGTAGVWRKECILDAGGWQHDTLTEDLDLSYRAQLKGWKFLYKEEIESPGELPVAMSAIKSQQYRWNKGAAETTKKILFSVLKSKLSFPHKFRAILHLMNSTIFLFLLIAALLSVPMLYIKHTFSVFKPIFDFGTFFVLGFLFMSYFYWVSSKKTSPSKTFNYYLKNFPAFLVFSMGMTLHNATAVFEGYIGRKTPFVRTPKLNIIKKNDSWEGRNSYLTNSLNISTLLEGMLFVYFSFGVVYGVFIVDYGLVLFHFLLAIGFLSIFVLSLRPAQPK